MKKVSTYFTLLAFALFSLSNANAQISKAEIRLLLIENKILAWEI